MFLARALTGQPELLLLDEPTSGVDITTRHAVLHLLGDLNESGISIVLTTHDLNGMAAHLPHLVCLNRRVIAAGTAGRGAHRPGAGGDVRCGPGRADAPRHAGGGRLRSGSLSVADAAPRRAHLGAGAPGVGGTADD